LLARYANDVLRNALQRFYHGFLHFKNGLRCHCTHANLILISALMYDLPWVHFCETNRCSVTLARISCYRISCSRAIIGKKYSWGFVSVVKKGGVFPLHSFLRSRSSWTELRTDILRTVWSKTSKKSAKYKFIGSFMSEWLSLHPYWWNFSSMNIFLLKIFRNEFYRNLRRNVQNMIWYDKVWYDMMGYDMIYDMIWYDIWLW